MNISEYTLLSTDGITQLHGIQALPLKKAKGILVIAHGLCEHIGRYNEFAGYAADNSFICMGHDMIGHGKSLRASSDLGYIPNIGGMQTLIDDFLLDIGNIKKEHPELPLFVFGHGVGSFIARIVCSKNTKGMISGGIFSGSADSTSTGSFSIAMLDTICDFTKERGYSSLCEKLVFGKCRVNHRNRKSYHWLSENGNTIDSYQSDELFGIRPSLSTLGIASKLRKTANSESIISAVSGELGILLISGENDPYGLYGEGILNIGNRYYAAGVSDTTVKIINSCGHDIFSEPFKNKTFEYIISWLNSEILEAI